MEIESLIFLEGDPIAQRLVAAWPQAGSGKRKVTFDVMEKWADIANVRIEHVLERRISLFKNGICGPDGKVDENALKYVRSEIVRRMGITKRGKEEPKGAAKAPAVGSTGQSQEEA